SERRIGPRGPGAPRVRLLLWWAGVVTRHNANLPSRHTNSRPRLAVLLVLTRTNRASHQHAGTLHDRLSQAFGKLVPHGDVPPGGAVVHPLVAGLLPVVLGHGEPQVGGPSLRELQLRLTNVPGNLNICHVKLPSFVSCVRT